MYRKCVVWKTWGVRKTTQQLHACTRAVASTKVGEQETTAETKVCGKV